MGAGGFATRTVATAVVATDGTGDFTDIQTAIDSLPVGGGVVYVKEGIYTITSELVINKDNVSIIGAGKSSQITTDENISMLTSDNKSGLFISQLYFNGAGAGHASNIGIEFNTVVSSSITSCWFTDCGGVAVQFLSSSRNTFSLNDVTTSIGNGVVFLASAQDIITSNKIYNNGAVGLLLSSNISDSIISNNIIDTNSADGLRMTGGNECLISGNRCVSNVAFGLVLANSSNNSVIGNHCLNNGSGVGVHSGLEIIGTGATNSLRNFVSGNVCSNTSGGTDQSIGIREGASDVDKNIIISNVCLDNVTSQIVIAGADTQVGHNITS